MRAIFNAEDINKFMSIFLLLLPSEKNKVGDEVLAELSAEDSGFVDVFSTDLLISVKCCIKAEVVDTGSCVVSFRSLSKAILGFTVKSEKFISGVSKIEIISSDRGIKIQSVSTIDNKEVSHTRNLPLSTSFLAKSSFSEEGLYYSLPVGGLAYSLNKIGWSIGASEDSGVLLKISDDRCMFAATNGVSLTECVFDFDSRGEASECTLPSFIISRIKKPINALVASNSLLDLYIEDSTVTFGFSGFMVKCPLSCFPFPDYSKVFLSDGKEVTIDSGIFYDNLKSLAFSSSKEDDNRVSLIFKKDSMDILTETCSNKNIPVLHNGSDKTVDFNISLLEGCINNISSDSIKLFYKDGSNAVTFYPVCNEEVLSNVRSAVAPLKR